MLTFSQTFRIAIITLALLAMGATLWFGFGQQSVAAQQSDTATCAPTGSDAVDASTISVDGYDVTWTDHAQACSYQVTLKSKPNNESLATAVTTKAAYTISADLLTEGGQYEITLRLLDRSGNAQGIASNHLFTFYTPIPDCAKPTAAGSQSGVTPTPTPLPNFSPSATSCMNKPPLRGGVIGASGGPPTPGPGSGIGELMWRPRTDSSDTTAGKAVNAASSSNFSHAIHVLNCASPGTPCPSTPTGVTAISGNVTAREPKLPQGKSWRDYHYFSRMHVVNPAKRNIICPSTSGISYTGPEHISVGFATGIFGTTVYNNELIVEKYYRDVTDNGKVKCEIVATGKFHRDHSAIYFDLSHTANGVWRVNGWFGQWETLASAHTTWTVAPGLAYGQEIWARNGDKQNVLAPLNFIHKVGIKSGDTLGPWHGEYISSSLNDRSASITQAPLAVNDLVGDDRTSISTCVTNSSKLCD